MSRRAHTPGSGQERLRRLGTTFGFVLPALAALLVASEPALADETRGCIAIIVDDKGNNIISADATPTIDRDALMEQFYESGYGTQDYDFALFFPIFTDARATSGRAVWSEVTGLTPAGGGISWGQPRDDRALFGSATSSLQGVSTYNAIFPSFGADPWPADPEDRFAGRPDSPLSTIAMEISHRWEAYVARGAGDFSLLRTDQVHWSFFLHTQATGPRGGASSQWGNVWVDNSDGTFTQAGIPNDGFSQLDQYLMGLRAPGEVDPFFLITPGAGVAQDADEFPFAPGNAPLTIDGTRVDIDIDDIIAANGPRVPDFAGSQKHFRLAFIMVAQAGTSPADADVAFLENYRAQFENYFAEETNFLGSVDTCITGPPLDIVFLLDRSGSFNDDLDTFQDRAGALADTLRAGSRGTRFGLASFKDFPFHPYGCDGVTDAAPCDPNSAVDYAYKVDLPLTDDLDAFKSAVDDLTPAPGFSGSDFPQSQYEALYQLMSDGPGRDLNNNGNTTDLGDIPPQSMNDDPSRPTFIFLFTDADFHDPGTDPNYPFPGAVSATRAEVIALAQNTPRIVGMAATDTVLGTTGDTPALRELVNLTGGAMFNLSAASDDFDLFIQQAIDEIPPPVTNPAQLLKKLDIDHARIEWKKSRHRGDHHDDHHRDHRHDRWRHHRDHGRDFGRHDGHHDHGHDHDHGHGHGDSHPSHDEPSIEIEGTLTLPDDLAHRDMESVGRVVVTLANKPFISSDLDFVVRRRDGRHGFDKWSARLRDESRLEVTLTWRSPRKAHYEISARFFPEQAGASGDSTPSELDLNLGLGETLHSREVTITHNQWRVRNERLWLGPNGDPPAPPENHHPVASTHSARAPAAQQGSDPNAADGSGQACAMSSRNSSHSNAGLLLWVLAAMLVRRRRRDTCGTGPGHSHSSPS